MAQHSLIANQQGCPKSSQTMVLNVQKIQIGFFGGLSRHAMQQILVFETIFRVFYRNASRKNSKKIFIILYFTLEH